MQEGKISREKMVRVSDEVEFGAEMERGRKEMGRLG